MALEKEMVQVAMNGAGVITRRHFLQTLSLGTAGLAASASIPVSFPDLMALHAADLRKRQMACILLWMAGGPSQLETFDPKPGTEHGGETKAIATAVPTISIAEGWGQHGESHEGHRARPVDDQQRGEPSARHLPAPYRLCTVGHDQAPAPRLFHGQ